MQLLDRTIAALDGATNALLNEQPLDAGNFLGPQLTEIFSEAQANGAADWLLKTVADHEVFQYLMQDPYTRRAFEKPRGYAGDAIMLDYIYRPSSSGLEGPAKTGHQVTTQGSTGLSIKFRRTLLSAYLNQVSSTVKKARILSVASGHCRELDDWTNFDNGVEFVALDQDGESCEYVKKCYQADWLTVKQESIKKLLKPKFDIGTFDYIYSAGLYDYLSESIAGALTKNLIERLKPGGTLLIANFVPTAAGRAYMELVMQWTLEWRTKEQLVAIFPSDARDSVSVFLDPHENVAYATWKKPAP